jgi:hypothetical protein
MVRSGFGLNALSLLRPSSASTAATTAQTPATISAAQPIGITASSPYIAASERKTSTK